MTSVNNSFNFSEFPTQPDSIFLGFSDNENSSVYLNNSDRTRHLYILGQSGIGKSVLIESLALQDIARGDGVCVFDPHGDLAKNIVSQIPEYRKNDIVFFDGTNISPEFSINPFQIFSTDEREQAEEKEQIAIMLKEFFIEIFGPDEFGPKLQDCFRNACLTLLDNTHSSLLDIPKLFSDEEFRKSAILNIKNPIVKAFWEHMYAPMSAEEKGKIAYFFIEKFHTSFPLDFQKFLGTSDSIDCNKIIRDKKIGIFSLAVCHVGVVGAKFLARIFLNRFLAASKQVQSDENFYLYLDELQFFKSQAVEELLINGRRYNIAVTIAHQYFAQLQDSFEDDTNGFWNTILGNVGSIIIGRVGPNDAQKFSEILGVNWQELINLNVREGYARIIENHEFKEAVKIQFPQR